MKVCALMLHVMNIMLVILVQINGQHIVWKQLWDLFGKISGTRDSSCGLSLLPKLKQEHLKLTSFSRMRVDLAAQVTIMYYTIMIHVHDCYINTQVLSKSVHDAFVFFGSPETKETEKFILMMDRFFDCLNVRNFKEWALKKKPDLKPYSSPDDPRFKV